MTKLHKRLGYSVEESITGHINELKDDAVGLWQIVPKGHDGFSLEGEELVDFIRRHIVALLKAGAKPVYSVYSGLDSEYLWTLTSKYGETTEEITEAIISEWKEKGCKDPEFDSIWFALPNIYKEKKPNQQK